MLRSLNSIIGYSFSAKNGTIGSCKDALIDDHKWTVRFLDVDTGGWLTGQRVLISPISLGQPDWSSSEIPTQLSKESIENSPALATNVPVSKQWEKSYYSHFGWPHYATGMHLWGMSPHPRELFNTKVEEIKDAQWEKNPNLRSVSEACGYAVDAENDRFGSVSDFIFDDETWAIRYLVIDTRKWLPSESVLVAPSWVKDVNWSDSSIAVSMTKEEIKNSPSYNETEPINKEYEMLLYDYHGRPKYWETEKR